MAPGVERSSTMRGARPVAFQVHQSAASGAESSRGGWPGPTSLGIPQPSWFAFTIEDAVCNRALSRHFEPVYSFFASSFLDPR